MLQFRESLVRSLLLGGPLENLKPGSRQQSTSQTKRKLADQKLEEMKGSARNVHSSALAAVKKHGTTIKESELCVSKKKIKTFCSDYNKYFFLYSFFLKYSMAHRWTTSP